MACCLTANVVPTRLVNAACSPMAEDVPVRLAKVVVWGVVAKVVACCPMVEVVAY